MHQSSLSICVARDKKLSTSQTFRGGLAASSRREPRRAKMQFQVKSGMSFRARVSRKISRKFESTRKPALIMALAVSRRPSDVSSTTDVLSQLDHQYHVARKRTRHRPRSGESDEADRREQQRRSALLASVNYRLARIHGDRLPGLEISPHASRGDETESNCGLASPARNK